ncbi:hypothetical protein ACH5RR_023293 [Cinchona calisaya]|uniref:Uncharacterized protein n=1 Tax=Cinchona calisaya TaxID=153742 RepID=A0ABD2ZA85_9GENT
MDNMELKFLCELKEVEWRLLEKSWEGLYNIDNDKATHQIQQEILVLGSTMSFSKGIVKEKAVERMQLVSAGKKVKSDELVDEKSVMELVFPRAVVPLLLSASLGSKTNPGSSSGCSSISFIDFLVADLTLDLSSQLVDPNLNQADPKKKRCEIVFIKDFSISPTSLNSSFMTSITSKRSMLNGK